MRDKDLFSQVSGVSQTVTAMAQNMLNTLTKRASTSDPFNNQEDSLFYGHLMGAGGTDLPENRSIDTERKQTHISVAEHAMPHERSFIQRLKPRDSIPERAHLNTR